MKFKDVQDRIESGEHLKIHVIDYELQLLCSGHVFGVTYKGEQVEVREQVVLHPYIGLDAKKCGQPGELFPLNRYNLPDGTEVFSIFAPGSDFGNKNVTTDFEEHKAGARELVEKTCRGKPHRLERYIIYAGLL